MNYNELFDHAIFVNYYIIVCKQDCMQCIERENTKHCDSSEVNTNKLFLSL